MLQARRHRHGEVQPAGSIRVGFTATRRLGNAVMRNRIKRRLREAVRAHNRGQSRGQNKGKTKGVMQSGFDYVVIGRSAAKNAAFDSIVDDLTSALTFVHKVK